METRRRRFQGRPGRLYEIPLLIAICGVALAVALGQKTIGRGIVTFLLTAAGALGAFMAFALLMALWEGLENYRYGRAVVKGVSLLAWFFLGAIPGMLVSAIPIMLWVETPKAEELCLLIGASAGGVAGAALRHFLQEAAWEVFGFGLLAVFLLMAGCMLGMGAGALLSLSPAGQIAAGAAGGLGASLAVLFQVWRVRRRRQAE